MPDRVKRLIVLAHYTAIWAWLFNVPLSPKIGGMHRGDALAKCPRLWIVGEHKTVQERLIQNLPKLAQGARVRRDGPFCDFDFESEVAFRQLDKRIDLLAIEGTQVRELGRTEKIARLLVHLSKDETFELVPRGCAAFLNDSLQNAIVQKM